MHNISLLFTWPYVCMLDLCFTFISLLPLLLLLLFSSKM